MSTTVKHKQYLYTLLPLISISALYFVDKSSMFSYCYTLIVFFVLHIILRENKELDNNFISFHYYLVFAIALFCFFRYQIPDYLGMTGPEGGIGTDDCRFYAQVVGGKDIFYTIRASLINLHPFSVYLKFVYPFEVHTPLNLVIFNITGVCFLPYFMKKLTFELFHDEKLSNRAALLTLFCPFTTYYGSILMRDMMVATLVAGGMYFYIRKKYIGLVLFSALLIFVRFGSFAYLMAGVLLIIRRNMVLKDKNTFRFTFLAILIIILFNNSYEFIQEFSGGKLGDSIFRSTDSKFFEETTIAELTKLPFPLNIILPTIFFLVNPMFSVPEQLDGYYIMSRYFHSALTGLYFFVLWPYIFNCIFSWFYHKKDANLELINIIMFAFCALLGIIDLQIRHKTVAYPFICLVAAYGMIRYDKNAKYMSAIFGGGMILAQLAIFTLGLL